MVECIYRLVAKERSEKNKAVSKAKKERGLELSASAGQNLQDFSCGVCRLLTQHDIGAMACEQPNSSEKDCPDIKGLL